MSVHAEKQQSPGTGSAHCISGALLLCLEGLQDFQAEHDASEGGPVMRDTEQHTVFILPSLTPLSLQCPLWAGDGHLVATTTAHTVRACFEAGEPIIDVAGPQRARALPAPDARPQEARPRPVRPMPMPMPLLRAALLPAAVLLAHLLKP